MRSKRAKLLRRMAFAVAVQMQQRSTRAETPQQKQYPISFAKPCHIYPRGHVRRIRQDLKVYYGRWVRDGMRGGFCEG